MNDAKSTTYDLNCEVPKITEENRAKQDNKTEVHVGLKTLKNNEKEIETNRYKQSDWIVWLVKQN